MQIIVMSIFYVRLAVIKKPERLKVSILDKTV